MDLTDVDVVAFDCDGVLWVGEEVMPGAVETLSRLAAAGKKCFFVTNNSQLGTAAFAKKFERLGFGEHIRPDSLWTSVSACEHYLSTLSPPPERRKAFVVGSEGLKEAVAASGFALVRRDGPANDAERAYTPEEMGNVDVDEGISVVVVGFDKTLSYFHLAFAVRCLLENEGCRLVVTNRDFQFPMKGKRLPGTGALVAAVCTGANREPDVVAAKPSPFMLEAILRAAGAPAHRCLMIGDMWSDIAFGHRAGARAALVLSGVATAADAKAWTGECRPDAVLTDVRGLLDEARVVEPLRRRARASRAMASALSLVGGAPPRLVVLGLAVAAAATAATALAQRPGRSSGRS